jgi:hypothetical protein
MIGHLYSQQLDCLLYSLVIPSYISNHFATSWLRTMFTHVISTSCALNLIAYVSYFIYDDYIGHVCDHLFYIMCDVAITSYGNARTNPIRNFYMEIVFLCQWLVMLSLRTSQLIRLFNEYSMEYT